jgi:acyl-CoA thioesterase
MTSPINDLLGIAAEDLADGRVRLTLRTGDAHRNEVGAVHGGVLALLLDGAMGRAVTRTLAPGETCATVQLSLQFLKPAQGTVAAVGSVARRGRTMAFLDGVCTGADGAVIARAQGTWVVRPKS